MQAKFLQSSVTEYALKCCKGLPYNSLRMAKMVGINFRVHEKLAAEFKSAVNDLNVSGASVGVAEAFHAALLMWSRSQTAARVEWVGAARNFDLEPLASNSLAQDIDAALAPELPPAQQPARRRKKA